MLSLLNIVLLKKKVMRQLDQMDFKNQRALIRVDFNVPLNEEQQVTDKTRIEAAKPTITHILASRCRN